MSNSLEPTVEHSNNVEITQVTPTDLEEAAPFRMWPLVSVIVVTHKRADRLPRALDSILAQTFRDMEVWVVHDGPPDQDTIRVYAKYCEKFDAAGIDFFPTNTEDHTGYYCQARNEATEHARGVYIANLDDDNEWLPDALSSLVAAMDEGENWPDIVYGRRRYVLDPEAPREFQGKPLIEGDSPFVPWDTLAELRLMGNKPEYNFIDSSDFLVAKGAMYRLGIATGFVWDESKRRFGDFYLVSNGLLAAGWKFKPLDKVVQIYHVSPDSVSLTRGVNETPTEKLL